MKKKIVVMPVFIAVAQDDDFGFDINSARFYENWKAGRGQLHMLCYSCQLFEPNTNFYKAADSFSSI